MKRRNGKFQVFNCYTGEVLCYCTTAKRAHAACRALDSLFGGMHDFSRGGAR